MQVSEINEAIKVAAVFEGKKVIPKWFFWGRRKYVVRTIEHMWRSKEGENNLLFFSVTDGSNVYELKLNQKTLEWHLEKLYTEG